MEYKPNLNPVFGLACKKIIPLAFDQSYSYYESICSFVVKLNEIIAMVNLQNMTISEFENRMRGLFNEFKTEIRIAFADYRIEMDQKFDDFTNEIETAWNDYKTVLTAEWQTEKQLNAAFRSDMQTAWSTYQTELNASIEIFKSQETAARQTFETNITNQQNTFQTTITQQQTTFETTVNSAITDMENEIDNIAVGASVETVSPVSTVSDNTNATQLTINNPATFINSGFANNYVRVYHCEDISTPQRVFEFIKRLKFSELATDTDIPNVYNIFERNIIIFENSALPGIIANSPTSFGFEAERTTRETAGVNVFYQNKIPVLGDNLTADNFNIEAPDFDRFSFPATIGTGYEQLTGDFHNVTLPCFMCVILDNTKNNFRFTTSLSSINIPVNGAYTYDTINNKIARDPKFDSVDYELARRIPSTMGTALVDPDPDNNVYANLFDLTIGKYNRQANANVVQNIPADLGNTPFYCEVVNTISNLRRQIRLYPCTAATSGNFYLCLETANGFGSWYKFTGTVVT